VLICNGELGVDSNNKRRAGLIFQIQPQRGARYFSTKMNDYCAVRDLVSLQSYAAFSSSRGDGAGRLGGAIDLIARTWANFL